MKTLNKIIPVVGLLLIAFGRCFAYTAFPYISSGTGNTGLTSGSIIGYTVYASNGSTVITARTTSGIVEVGGSGGTYIISGGLSVPDGTCYIIKWDRSDTSTVLGAAPTEPNNQTFVVQGQTNQLAFDGSGYVKSDNQTSVTLSSGQNIATLGGQAPPTNWNAMAVTSGGVVTANTTQIGSHAVSLDGNNDLTVNIGDIYGTALSSTTLAVNATQFNGHSISLDSAYDLNTDNAYWNGNVISTAVPNTSGVTVAAYASGEDPGTLVGHWTVDGTATNDAIMASLLANLWGSVTNSYNSTTHVLTTTYLRQNGSTTAYSNSTTYGSNISSIPVSGRTGSAGTLPN